MKKLLLLVLLLVTPGCVFRDYSTGSRVGKVIKFSRKGVFFKTWEGEMVLSGLRSGGGGAETANLWAFSIDEEHLRGENVALLAERVYYAMVSEKTIKVSYREDFYLNPLAGLGRGDTDYYLQSVEILP